MSFDYNLPQNSCEALLQVVENYLWARKVASCNPTANQVTACFPGGVSCSYYADTQTFQKAGQKIRVTGGPVAFLALVDKEIEIGKMASAKRAPMARLAGTN